MKIFHKYNLIIILVIVSVVSLYSFYSIRSERRDLMREMVGQATYFAKTVALGINSASYLERRDILVDYLDRMIPESKGWMRYGMITDLNNYAWINTVKEMEYETLNDEVSQSVLKNIKTKNSFNQVYYNDHFKEKILDISSLITVSWKERGVLRLGFSFENVEKKIDNAIFQSVVVGLASIIVGIFLSTMMARVVTKPVSKIVENSKEVARGNLNFPITTKSNIAEICELEQSIEQMKRDLKYVYLGGVFADFHHSIKSDLGLISANIAYIRQNAGQPERVKELLAKAEQIMDRVDYINSEINKYREYKKPQEVKMAAVDINQLLSEVIGSIRFTEKIILEKDWGQNIPHISADSAHLKKALGNIMTNAVEAMGGDGRLKIKTEALESSVEIEISDTGCGIPKGDLTCIFEPSYSTKKKKGGEGIGLAMAKIIIEDTHSGKIDVVSEEGKGTMFIIRMPCS